MKFTKPQIVDFTILVFRWYIAFYMISYGYGKMTGGQFGHPDPAMLDKPLRDVDKFHLAWYLFGLGRSFDIGVGLLQIIGSILLVINRTTLVGALFLLPVLVQICLVDLAFTTDAVGPALVLRLMGMITCDLLILGYYKDRMIQVWHQLTDGMTTRYTYKWWVFLLLPVLGLGMDFILAIVTGPVHSILNWFGYLWR